jgi:hypothetical protein
MGFVSEKIDRPDRLPIVSFSHNWEVSRWLKSLLRVICSDEHKGNLFNGEAYKLNKWMY